MDGNNVKNMTKMANFLVGYIAFSAKGWLDNSISVPTKAIKVFKRNYFF